jgi:hypothetical protein
MDWRGRARPRSTSSPAPTRRSIGRASPPTRYRSTSPRGTAQRDRRASPPKEHLVQGVDRLPREGQPLHHDQHSPRRASSSRARTQPPPPAQVAVSGRRMGRLAGPVFGVTRRERCSARRDLASSLPTARCPQLRAARVGPTRVVGSCRRRFQRSRLLRPSPLRSVRGCARPPE